MLTSPTHIPIKWPGISSVTDAAAPDCVEYVHTSYCLHLCMTILARMSQ